MQNQFFYRREKCPACHSDSVKSLYKKPFDQPPVSDYLTSFYSPQGGIDFSYFTNAFYELYECEECGGIYQREVPNESFMKILYDKWIDPATSVKKHKKTDNLKLQTSYAQEIASIINYLQKAPSELRFLDFGMGWGMWALMAKGFGCESYGSEISDERIKFASIRGTQVVNWDEIQNHKFDFINTEQVFEHITNPLETLIHLKGALSSNGLIKISVPTANNIEYRLRVMDWKAPKGTRLSLNPVAPLEHINYFRRSTLLKMAKIAGMKEVVIPMRSYYFFTNILLGVSTMVKNIFRLIYRNTLKKQNYLLFQKEK